MPTNPPIVIKQPMPDEFFRWEDVSWKDFTDWASDPANQTEDNFRKAGIYHPLVRQVWVEKGFIVIETPDTGDTLQQGMSE